MGSRDARRVGGLMNRKQMTATYNVDDQTYGRKRRGRFIDVYRKDGEEWLLIGTTAQNVRGAERMIQSLHERITGD